MFAEYHLKSDEDSIMSRVRDDSHPSQDRTRRHAIDQLLRKYGYRIYSRKNGAEPVWERCGELYGEKKALRTIPYEVYRRVVEDGHGVIDEVRL